MSIMLICKKLIVFQKIYISLELRETFKGILVEFYIFQITDLITFQWHHSESEIFILLNKWFLSFLYAPLIKKLRICFFGF